MATYPYEEILCYLQDKVYPDRMRYNVDDNKSEKREKENRKRCLRKHAASFRVSDGDLKRIVSLAGEQYLADIVSDEKNRKDIFNENHSSVLGGHPGETKTIKKICQRYFWPGITNDIRKWIKDCDKCQHHAALHPLKKELTPIKTEHIWEIVGIDFVGPLPETKYGNKYLLTCTDLFSKWPVAMPLPSKEASGVALSLIKVFSTYGFPQKVLTDNGKEFVNELNKEMYETLKINHKKTAVYHPQCNGQDENTNKNIKRRLKKLVNENQDDWDILVDPVLFSLRTEKQSSTKYSPFEIMFGGRQPLMPSQIKDNFPVDSTLEHITHVKVDEAVEESIKEMKNLTKKVKDNLTFAQDKQKKYFDAKEKSKECRLPDLKVGEMVMLYDKTRKRRRHGGLQPSWIGPFKITKISTAGNFTLGDGGKALRGSYKRELIKKTADEEIYPSKKKQRVYPEVEEGKKSILEETISNDEFLLARTSSKNDHTYAHSTYNGQQSNEFKYEELVNEENDIASALTTEVKPTYFTDYLGDDKSDICDNKLLKNKCHINGLLRAARHRIEIFEDDPVIICFGGQFIDRVGKLYKTGELDIIVEVSKDKLKNPFIALDIQNNISDFDKFKKEFPELYSAHSILSKKGCLSFSQIFMSKVYNINYGSLAMDRLSFIDASIMMTMKEHDDAVSGDAVSGDAFGGDAVSGDAVSGDAFGGDAVSGDAVSGDAFSGDAVSGDAVSGDAVNGDAVIGDAIGGNDFISCDDDIDPSAVLDNIWMKDNDQQKVLCAVVNKIYKLYTVDIKDLQKGEISDNIIDAYLDIISKEINPPFQFEILCCGFLTFVLGAGRNDFNIGKKMKKRMLSADKIFGVYNKNHHWILVVIEPENRLIYQINPLGESQKDMMVIHQRWSEWAKNVLKDDQKWEITAVNHARQSDSTSCGLFCLKFAEEILRQNSLELSQKFSNENLQKYRYSVALKLLQVGGCGTWCSNLCRLCGQEDYPKSNMRNMKIKLSNKNCWVQCDKCLPHKWYHTICAGLPIIEKTQKYYCHNFFKSITEIQSKRSQSAQESPPDLSYLDPYRQASNYFLVHRQDLKNCPKKVSRCEVCRLPFTSKDIIVIKTKGHREYYNKKSKEMMKNYGNIYIHFLHDCLTLYDPDFSFSKVLALKTTLNYLPPLAIPSLKKQDIIME